MMENFGLVAHEREGSIGPGLNAPDLDGPDTPLMYPVYALFLMAKVFGAMAYVVFVVLPVCALVWLYVLRPVWLAVDFVGPFQGVLFVLCLFAAFMVLCGVLAGLSELRWRWRCARRGLK